MRMGFVVRRAKWRDAFVIQEIISTNISNDIPLSPVGVKIPFTIQVPTRYGPMLINRNDINQTNALVKTGEGLGHSEIEFLGHVLKISGVKNAVFLDVGANVGVFSLGMRPYIGDHGKVYAFEPQRIIFNMLAGSVALNSFTNILLFNCAVGEKCGQIEVPQFNYNKRMNFGSIEFGPEQKEVLDQDRIYDPQAIEFVPVRTIDSLLLSKCDLIKIDVEGMEISVLNGASETIGKCRPFLFIEHIKSDAHTLRGRIESFKYSVYLYGNDFICIPSEKSEGFIDELKQAVHVLENISFRISDPI
jgi:FkbM family methyltransferase